MSRVIKAAIWEENPHLIHTPEPPKPEASAAEGDGLDEEARAHMLAEIADKEQRAIQLLKDAKVEAEIIKQEAQAERERLLAEGVMKGMRQAIRMEPARSGKKWQRALLRPMIKPRKPCVMPRLPRVIMSNRLSRMWSG